MNRRRLLVLLPLFLAFIAIGCQKEKPATSASVPPASAASTTPTTDGTPPTRQVFFHDSPLADTASTEYSSALLKAVSALADRNLTAALASLKEAQKHEDNLLIQQEIDRVQGLIVQQQAAQATATDIEAVLLQGKAEEAANLAAAALKSYGATDHAERFIVLKRQADALLTETAPNRQQLLQRAEAAQKENDLRGALLAYEQLLAAGDDAQARQRYDQVRTVVARYDNGRHRATECRRDPDRLDEALAALNEAASAWDTPVVRQEIEEIRLALACRRERLAVADFEVRGDLGLPLAGRTVADELLPAFRGRFDLVERGQLAAVLAELKLEAGGLADNELSRAEVGRLAKARYLVVGSITPAGGLLVNARLIDTQSGLIVQTARLMAATPEELLRRLPELAQQLQMTDQERLVFAAQQAQSAPALAPLPPPIANFTPQVGGPPPPAIVTSYYRPPILGQLTEQDFDKLRPLPPEAGPFVITAPSAPEGPFRQSLLNLQLQLGDNLYLRGQFAEAHRHFRLAFDLAPSDPAVRIRVDACRPHLPPPIVVQPLPMRDRVALLPFIVLGDTRMLPPELSHWLPQQLGPYFCPPFDVVEPGELYWYMNRLGLSVQDVLFNPVARRWLGRAVGVRCFVFGMLRPANSFTVNTYLVDSEGGYRVGEGSLFVRGPWELKLRLRELAQETLLSPTERLRLQQEAALREAALLEAQHACDSGQFTVAIDLFGRLKKKYPFNVQIGFLARQAEARAVQVNLELGRRQQWELQQQQWSLAAQRQAQLAMAAEAARQQAAMLDGSRFQGQRQRAGQQLLTQGRLALATNNYPQAIQLLESAAALAPSDEVFRELASARARSEEAIRRRAAEERARREAQLRRQQEADLAEMRSQLAEAERRRQDLEAQSLQQLRQRDQRAYTKLLADAERLLAEEKYDAALAALTSARQLSTTDEVERLFTQALVGQAKAKAKAQGAQQVAALEEQLAAEKARREAAEAMAKRNRDLYVAAMKAAEDARTAQRFDVAIAKYREAGQLFQTPEVLKGLRAAEEGLVAKKREAEAQKRLAAEDSQRIANLAKLEEKANALLKDNKVEEALAVCAEALKLAPTDSEWLSLQSRLQVSRDQTLATTRLKEAKANDAAEQRVRNLVGLAQSSIMAQQFAAAETYLEQIEKLKPSDPAIATLRSDLRQAQARAEKEKSELMARQEAAAKANAAAEAARLKKIEQQQATLNQRQLARFLEQAQRSIKAEQFDVAAEALRQAAQLSATDPKIGQLQRQLSEARATAQAAAAQRAAAEKARTEAEEKVRGEKFALHLKKGREAMQEENFAEAVKELQEAVKLYPGDSDAALLLSLAESKLKAGGSKDEATTKADAEATEKAKAKAEAEMQAKEQLRQRKLQALRLVNRGKELRQQKRFAEAIEAFEQASKLDPEQSEARTLLNLTQQQETERKAMANRPTQPTPPATRPTLPTTMPTRSQPIPTRPIPSVTKPLPTPTRPAPTTSRSLPSPTRPTQPAAPASSDVEREYQRLLTAGERFEQAGRWSDAVEAYQRALKLKPNDRRAAEALRKAEITLYLERGKRDLKAKKFDEAIKSFEEVLRRDPNHADAKRGLEAAKKRQ